MVNPIGNAAGRSGVASLDAARTAAKAETVKSTAKDVSAAETATPAARFARLGPPIDANRVSEVRAAIASGRYTIDADRLAAAMLAFDLPERGA